MASNASQLRAARPVPPYTMSWSGFSATSGSRLFMSILKAASCCQPLQVSAAPVGAITSLDMPHTPFRTRSNLIHAPDGFAGRPLHFS